jgi:ABC-2 type transport system permease protein
MLWYKAWIETRARFLSCLGGLVFFCTIFVHHAQTLIWPGMKSEGYNVLFAAHQFLVLMWILSVVLLGMGGLVREKAVGASSFTWVLPVSRAYLVGVRIVTCFLETIVLGIVPWLAIFLVSSLTHMPILFTQVCFYILILIGGGSLYFALAVLVSSLVSGEYTAPAVAFGLVFASTIATDVWLRPFNPWRLVSGDNYVDRTTWLLVGPVPWAGIFVSLCTASLILAASVVITQKREF